MDVPDGSVPLVPVLEAAVVVAVVAFVLVMLVTGAPPPVSVAVVPVVDGWMVSVDPALLSGAFWLHAAAMTSRAMAIAFLMTAASASSTPTLRLAQVMKAFRKRGVAMPEVIGRFTPQTFALLRIVSGLMFMLHGAQKALGWPPSEMKGPLPPIALAAGWIELVGGFLIFIGLFAGIAAFICSGEMAVAYFMVHAKWTGVAWIPFINKGEAAVLYCFIFLYIAAHGAGIWSVDNAMRKRTPVVTS